MKEIVMKWRIKGEPSWNEYGNFNINSLEEAEKFIEDERKVGASECEFLIIERMTSEKILKRM